MKIFFAVFLFAVVPSVSAQNSASFDVSASIAQVCTLKTYTNNGNSLSVQLDPTVAKPEDYVGIHGMVQVKCTLGSENVVLKVGEGLQPKSGSTCAAPKRQLKNAQNQYMDYRFMSTHNTDWMDWGCDVSNDVVMSFADDTEKTFNPVFIVPSHQNASIGTYSDVITLSLVF